MRPARSLIAAIYTQLLRALLPFALLRLYWRARQEPLYAYRVTERLGFYKTPPLCRRFFVPETPSASNGQNASNVLNVPDNRPVWVHAVSLGETQAAQPLIEALLNRGLWVVLTHMTATGRAAGARLFSAAIQAGQLHQHWLTYDTPGAIGRFLKHVQPRCGVLIETEVWPNMVLRCHDQNIPLFLVSARLSARSLRKVKRFGAWGRQVYGNLSAVLAQTAADAERFATLGIKRLSVVGNLKFDVLLPQAACQAGRAFKAQLDRPVLIVANTRDGEEALLLHALKQVPLIRNVLLLLVPRHPQRFAQVAQLLEKAKINFVCRSSGAAVLPNHQVWLGDSIGEMAFYYAMSDVAIQGGSFLPFGGHNLIEASQQGVPVLLGPYMFNFAQAAKDAIAANAAVSCEAFEIALQRANFYLTSDNLTAHKHAARQFAAAYQGATEKILHHLKPYL